MNHTMIIAYLVTYLPRIPESTLSQLATHLIDSGVVRPTMDEATAQRRLDALLQQLVAQAIHPPSTHQTAGDGAIVVGNNVIDSTLTTFIIQILQERPPAWFQIPPVSDEIAITELVGIDTAEASQRLFQALPTMVIPAVSQRQAPETRLPFRRQATFVGRETELKAIAETLKSKPTAALIPAVASGILGIGKTSLAIEFAHRYGSYFAGGVFWVDCSNPALVASSIAQSGGQQHLGLFRELDGLSLDEQVGLVLKAWSEPTPRLLIFDNCEDTKIVHQYAPKVGGSRVLVTARRETWGQLPVIQLGLLSHAESTALLLQLAPHLRDGEAEQIAAFCEYLPLALHLAGSYLGHYRRSASDYLATIGIIDPLTHRSFEGRGIQDGDTELPGRREINLLKILVAALEGVSGDARVPSVARLLLDGMSHLAPSEPVFVVVAKQILPDDTDIDDIVDAVNLIRNLGLVESRGVDPDLEVYLQYPIDGHTMQVHRLVHGFLHHQLATNEGRDSIEMAIANFLQFLTSLDYPQDLLLLERHALWLIERALPRRDEQSATLAYNMAHVYMLVGRYAEAERLIEAVLPIVIDSPDQVGFMRALDLQGMLYQSFGRYVEAEPIHLQALALAEQIHGPNHSDVVDMLNHVGMLYTHLTNYQQAEDYLGRAKTILEVNGDRHTVDYFLLLNNLSQLYLSQARLEDSEALMLQTIEGLKAQLGEVHPRMLTPFNNLGYLYLVRGRYAEAETYIQQALNLSETIFGIAHPETITSRANLAALYGQQGRFEESNTTILQALEQCQETLGPDHPNMIKILSTAGSVMLYQHRFAEAETYLLRALKLCQDVLSDQHLVIIECFNNLGMFYQTTKQYAEAESYLNRALAISQPALGTHPMTAQILSNLGVNAVDHQRFPEAIAYHHQALEIRKTLFDTSHPDYSQSLNNLGLAYVDHEQPEQGIEYLTEAFNLLVEHPTPILINVCHNLAHALWIQGRVLETWTLYELALPLAIQVYGHDHDLTDIIETASENLKESLLTAYLFTQALLNDSNQRRSVEEWYADRPQTESADALAQAWDQLKIGVRDQSQLLHSNQPAHVRRVIQIIIEVLEDPYRQTVLDDIVASQRSPVNQTLLMFLQAPSLAESRQILETHHDLLLTDEALAILQDAYTEFMQAGEQQQAETLTSYITLLNQCRQAGIAATFDALDSPSVT